MQGLEPEHKEKAASTRPPERYWPHIWQLWNCTLLFFFFNNKAHKYFKLKENPFTVALHPKTKSKY